MRKSATTILMLLSMTATAEDKTVLAETLEAMQPATTGLINYVHKSMMQSLSDGEGALGQAARDELTRLEATEGKASEGEVSSVRECMKLNSVTDENVNECTQSLTELERDKYDEQVNRMLGIID